MRSGVSRALPEARALPLPRPKAHPRHPRRPCPAPRRSRRFRSDRIPERRSLRAGRRGKPLHAKPCCAHGVIRESVTGRRPTDHATVPGGGQDSTPLLVGDRLRRAALVAGLPNMAADRHQALLVGAQLQVFARGRDGPTLGPEVAHAPVDLLGRTETRPAGGTS